MGILDNIKNAILGKQEEEPVEMMMIEDEDAVTEFMEWLTNPARKKKHEEEDKRKGRTDEHR